MSTKFVALFASTAFALGLSLVGQPAARAGQPAATMDMAAQPDSGKGEVPKEKPKPKPKAKKGKGKPGEDKMFNPQPEPPGDDSIKPKVNP